MSEYIAETFEHNGYTIKIIQDQDAMSPSDWENDGLFIITTRNRYFERLHGSGSGRNGSDASELLEDKDFCKKYWIFPLNAYIHGGVALSLGTGGQFSDPWDSGQIGFVFAAKSEWKYRTMERKKCASAHTAAKGKVEEWNQYLSGDVWGFVVETPDGEEVESCWGNYGMDWAITAAKEAVPSEPALVGGESMDEAMDEAGTLA